MVPDAAIADELVDAPPLAPPLAPTPNPSALRAWKSEWRKLCTCCVGFVAEAAVAAVGAAVMPPAEADDTPVVAVAPEVALREIGAATPMTCSRVCSKLENSPWVVVGVELLDALELLELDAEAAELCADFL